MSALSAVGTMMQASGAQQADTMNANLATYNAGAAGADGAVKLQQEQLKTDLQLGNERAQYGASGVSSSTGSALNILKQSAAQAALDSVTTQNNTNAKVYGYQTNAAVDYSQGQTAIRSGMYTAAGQLFNGVSSIATAGV